MDVSQNWKCRRPWWVVLRSTTNRHNAGDNRNSDSCSKYWRYGQHDEKRLTDHDNRNSKLPSHMYIFPLNRTRGLTSSMWEKAVIYRKIWDTSDCSFSNVRYHLGCTYVQATILSVGVRVGECWRCGCGGGERGSVGGLDGLLTVKINNHSSCTAKIS
jgi:hypothetical protein